MDCESAYCGVLQVFDGLERPAKVVRIIPLHLLSCITFFSSPAFGFSLVSLFRHTQVPLFATSPLSCSPRCCLLLLLLLLILDARAHSVCVRRSRHRGHCFLVSASSRTGQQEEEWRERRRAGDTTHRQGTRTAPHWAPAACPRRVAAAAVEWQCCHVLFGRWSHCVRSLASPRRGLFGGASLGGAWAVTVCAPPAPL